MADTTLITGPLWRARNASADATGGIHDDATATKLGFRGGTVAGSVHMDQFVPVLRDAFGDAWLEGGALSLHFRNATIDGEAVRVSIQPPAGRQQIRVWMHREDGMEVMAGTASVGDHSTSELRSRDLRPVGPATLRILRNLKAPATVDVQHTLTSERQLDRHARNLLSTPIPEYAQPSARWGGLLASPSAVVELLWGVPTAIWREQIGSAVGLFGAIEVALHNGPLLLDREYRVQATIVGLTDSPKTEGFWFDSSAHDADGKLIATHRMLLRFMKESSPLYAAA